MSPNAALEREQAGFAHGSIPPLAAPTIQLVDSRPPPMKAATTAKPQRRPSRNNVALVEVVEV
jgi:hypothetical protein